MRTDRTAVHRALSQALMRDADSLVAEIGLLPRLERAGFPVRIGSSSFELMVNPDIDIGVLCDPLVLAPAWAALDGLLDHPLVNRIDWHDNRGPFNVTGEPQDEGIYCGIRVMAPDATHDRKWKIDVWFFPHDAPRPEIPLRDRLLTAPEHVRDIILRIKTEAVERGVYGSRVHGVDIYRAVLDHDLQDLDDLLEGRRA